MRRLVKLGPVFGQGATGHGVHEVGRQFCERAQDEAVTQYIAARYVSLFDDFLPIEQQIDVQGPGNEGIRSTLPPGEIMNFLQLPTEFRWREIRVDRGHRIEEIVAGHSERRIPVN